MSPKRAFARPLGVLSILMLLSCLSLSAEMRSFVEFNDIQIPLNMKHDETVFEKGSYDFEVLILDTETGRDVYFLKIKKEGKQLCLLEGTHYDYKEIYIGRYMTFYVVPDDPEIPEGMRIRVFKYPKEKMLHITFESGKNVRFYRLERIVFKIGYEEYILNSSNSLKER